MCGNFGLLVLNNNTTVDENTFASNLQLSVHKVTRKKESPDVQLSAKSGKSSKRVQPVDASKMSELDRSMGASMHRVAKLHGVQYQDAAADKNDVLLSPLKVLEAQTACTEIRGGQAGGFSTFEYRYQSVKSDGSRFAATTLTIPRATRVRRVALKRYPLAADIAAGYLSERHGMLPDTSGSFTAIGHTRFATSSINIASELHPHEWVPFHHEDVWLFDTTTGRFGRSQQQVGIHITHNGDFDELEAYGHVMLNEEIGLWLDRIHYCSSGAKLGDSPKIAGLMDLLRVQGRWGAAAKAAWVRCVVRNPGDVADGEQLCAEAPNSFPNPQYWDEWRVFLDDIWTRHVNNVILTKAPRLFDVKNKRTYSISYKATKQLCADIVDTLFNSKSNMPPAAAIDDDNSSASSIATRLGVQHWKLPMLRAFVHHTVRGFLHADLYTALTEVLSRATGSFGIQVHCTLEPGVVVIASKGQPMSLSFDPIHPIVLFGSEAEAMAVPVFESGKWLPERIDLDNKGEIIRIGAPRALIEGTYATTADHVTNIAPGAKSGTTTAAAGSGRLNRSGGALQSNKEVGKQEAGSAAGPSTTGGGGGVGSKALAAASASSKAVNFNDTTEPAASQFFSRKSSSDRHQNDDNLEVDELDDTPSGTTAAMTESGGKNGNLPKKGNDFDVDDEEDDEGKTLFKQDSASGKHSSKFKMSLAATGRSHSTITGVKVGMMLECGIEIRSYSLVTRAEAKLDELKRRMIPITSAPLPYDPKVDLVARDLAITPAVLAAIDEAWKDPTSIESMTSRALCSQLVRSIQRRLKLKDDTTDFIIAGIEASVWLAEQFAADVRRIFPHLNVVCTSTNKLVGFGDDKPSQVFFPAADEVLARRVDPEHTCVLLISQSGQTFSSLHATRRLAKFLPERIWVLTGCFNSKMEQVIKERYQEIDKPYKGNRVFNNYSGHRPAEPTSVAVAAAWHTLTRLLMDIVDTCRRKIPGGRLVHPWDYDRAAITIQAWFMGMFASKVRRGGQGGKKVRVSAATVVAGVDELSDTDNSSNGGGDEHDEDLDAPAKPQLQKALSSKPGLQRSNTRRASTQVYSMGAVAAAAASGNTSGENTSGGAGTVGGWQRPTVVMKLSDGCIGDLHSILSEGFLATISEIVGYDVDGNPLASNSAAFRDPAEINHTKRRSFTSGGGLNLIQKPTHHEKMANIERRLTKAVSSGSLKIGKGKSLSSNGKKTDTSAEMTVHERLVKHGQMWGDHINEPWNVMVLAAIYVIGSVCLGLPLFGMIGDGVYALLKHIPAAEAYVGSNGALLFSLRYPSFIRDQHFGYTLVGLFLQLIDALFFIYLGKHITRALRIYYGRAFHARMGKRTIVIVDNPTVHQLLENFVSKLYSQAYSVNGVDVHGASGLDHFVHRFTHRVVRGVLLAIGRPDGRLCCLSKSESSLLLAVKQAAFIRNPKFEFEGSGPDIITVGHNPYQPNIGLAHHVVLSGTSSSASKSLKNGDTVGATIHGHVSGHGLQNTVHLDKYGQLQRQVRGVRRKFVDEFLYARLFIAQKPFTVSILRNLRLSLDERQKAEQSKATTKMIKSMAEGKSNNADNAGAVASSKSGASAVISNKSKRTPSGRFNFNLYPNRMRPTSPRVDHLGLSRHSTHTVKLNHKQQNAAILGRSLPYGAHHIDPSILSKAESIECSVFADFVVANRDLLTKKILDKGISAAKQRSSDPGVILAFSGKLDAQARQIQELQVVVQQFYECRVASLERYMAFCVMFHAMAQSSCQPWLSVPWDMARSQSNLRVATTASPISVGADEEASGAKVYAQKLANKMRRFTVYF